MKERENELKALRRTRRRDIWRRLKKNRLAMVGLVILVIFVLLAVFADVLADYQTEAIKISRDRLQGPSAEHWFGTDVLGRDIFARIIHGARVSLSMGLGVALLVMVAGTLIGAVAAYFGGITEAIIMRIADIFICIPSILLSLALVAAFGTNTINLVLALVIASIAPSARFVRSVILTVVGQDYIEAARAEGMGSMKIIITPVLPNAIGPIIVDTTMGVAAMILALAGLSYLGLGIQPPTPEWGAMLSDAASQMMNYPHLVIFPGLSILLSAAALNFLGDGLRDALDPRLKD